MSEELKNIKYRTGQLERKVLGMQRQIEIMNARQEVTSKKHERRIRDLEIRAAVQSGVPQNKVANIYELSASRVNQILKKVG